MSEPLPERMILRSNPLEAVFLLVAIGALAFIILTRIPLEMAAPVNGRTARWIVGLGIAAIGTFATAGSLRRLSLDPDGFEEDSLFRSRRVAWRDCSRFEVGSSGGRVLLLFVRTRTLAGEIRLRSRYGRKLDDVAALMNRFRARAVAA
ncbi:MAG: hypothetical protein QM773_21395 [Hyphomonadaceae bacterium]